MSAAQESHKQHEKHAGDQKQHEQFIKRAIELSRKAFIVDKTGGVFGYGALY